MSAAFKGRLYKAAALVPLAALSIAWTASIAGVGAPTQPTLAAQQPPAQQVLPDGTSVPTQAIEAPASVSDQASLGLGSNADATQILSTASTSGIPSAALAAYQRAETVINAADTTCRLPWQLVAAIGRVESNHGRFGGNTLDDNGVATPGIYGPALDGTKSTTLIKDTDAGQYDNDTTFDRAVGPMQFIPSTWSVVGVDADGDGARNPQDIDDAALGTAVYLCSGEDDLSTDAGRRASVFRYNRSQSYVDLVLSVMQAYLAGDFTTIPNSAVAAGQLVAAPQQLATPPKQKTSDKVVSGNKSPTDTTKTTPDTETTPVEPAPTPAPAPAPAPAPPKTPDKNGGAKPPATGGAAAGLPQLPAPTLPPVDKALTLAEATLQCTTDGLVAALQPDLFQQCLTNYMKP